MVLNLNGNPAHLALLCDSRQQAFELDLTGSTLIFQVSPSGCLSAYSKFKRWGSSGCPHMHAS